MEKSLRKNPKESFRGKGCTEKSKKWLSSRKKTRNVSNKFVVKHVQR